jgi:hypothetical protein
MDGLETARRWQAAFANDSEDTYEDDEAPKGGRPVIPKPVRKVPVSLCRMCKFRARDVGFFSCQKCRQLYRKRNLANNEAKLCLHLKCKAFRDGNSMHCSEHRRYPAIKRRKAG